MARPSVKRSFTYEYRYDGLGGLPLSELADLVDTIKGDFPSGEPTLRISAAYPGPQGTDNTVTLKVVAESK